MRSQFLTYLKEHITLSENSRLLLAISGGIDSMVMLKLFENTSYELLVAHCNFSLRVRDADEDAAFIRNYCRESDIPFVSIKFDTAKVAKERNLSTQMAARELRYDWFEKLKGDNNIDYIVTAHHAEDSFETALLNLSRGTGINGLKGILPKTGHLIRPLLFATKQEIKSFAEAENIIWREDSSNVSLKYKRNLIRHRVIPVLQEINPSLFRTFSHSSRRIKEAHDFIANETRKFLSKYIREDKEGITMPLDVFFLKENRAMLNYCLEELNFNIITSEAIFKTELPNSGCIFLSPSHRLLIDRKLVFVVPLKSQKNIEESIVEGQKELLLKDVRISIEKRANVVLELLKDPNHAFLNSEKLQFPLLLRHWQKGDRFRPFGMKGTKLVSDFLVDQKLSLYQKENTLVLLSGDEIVWLLGHRIAHEYGLSPKSDRILHLHLKNNK